MVYNMGIIHHMGYTMKKEIIIDWKAIQDRIKDVSRPEHLVEIGLDLAEALGTVVKRNVRHASRNRACYYYPSYRKHQGAYPYGLISWPHGCGDHWRGAWILIHEIGHALDYCGHHPYKAELKGKAYKTYPHIRQELATWCWQQWVYAWLPKTIAKKATISRTQHRDGIDYMNQYSDRMHDDNVMPYLEIFDTVKATIDTIERRPSRNNSGTKMYRDYFNTRWECDLPGDSQMIRTKSSQDLYWEVTEPTLGITPRSLSSAEKAKAKALESQRGANRKRLEAKRKAAAEAYAEQTERIANAEAKAKEAKATEAKATPTGTFVAEGTYATIGDYAKAQGKTKAAIYAQVKRGVLTVVKIGSQTTLVRID